MKKLLLLLLLSLGLISPSYADDAYDAYQKGDFKYAFQLWETKAKKGNSTAQYNLGSMYSNGEYVAQSDERAVYWYRKAADQGYKSAQYHLGIKYKTGTGVTKDYKQAAYWYRKAAEQGHAKAQNNLGVSYNNGEGVSQNYEQAVYWYRKAANQGHAEAQYNLGKKYKTGTGVSLDYFEAVYWLTKATNQRHTDAKKHLDETQETINRIYREGELGTVNRSKQIIDFFLKASSRGLGGDSKAQNILADLYIKDKGVGEKYSDVIRWFTQNADVGNIAAQKMLTWTFENGKSPTLLLIGGYYENGSWADYDKKEALKWFRKAANQGHAGAQFILGNKYGQGEVVLKDPNQAISWYLMAAKQGHAEAQYELGLTYIDQKDQKDQKNPLKNAAYWINQAHENGIKQASKVWNEYELWEHK